MSNPIKTCQKCGKQFETSRTGYTVNCPDCRASAKKSTPAGETAETTLRREADRLRGLLSDPQLSASARTRLERKLAIVTGSPEPEEAKMPETTQKTTPVKIFGPNLRHQEKGSFHVHMADCADCRHYGPGTKNGGDDGGISLDAASREAVVRYLYEDHIAEAGRDDDPNAWLDYDDLHVAPCVRFPEDASARPPAKAKTKRQNSTQNGKLEGEIDRAKSRQTGTTVVILDARQASDFNPDEGGRWVTMCVEHSNFVQHTERSLARRFRPVPQEWCETCMGAAKKTARRHK